MGQPGPTRSWLSTAKEGESSVGEGLGVKNTAGTFQSAWLKIMSSLGLFPTHARYCGKQLSKALLSSALYPRDVGASVHKC